MSKETRADFEKPANSPLSHLNALLRDGVAGVVAPQSGGCARHVLSQRVDCRADEQGTPVFALDGSNASSLRLLLDSTVTLIIESPDCPGEEYHVTGHLAAAEASTYKLNVIRTYHVRASGEKRPL